MKHITFFATQGDESASYIGRYFPLAKEINKGDISTNILTLHHNYKSLPDKCIIKDGVRTHYVGQMSVKKIGEKKVYMNSLELIYIIATSTLSMFIKGLSIKSDIMVLCKPQPVNSTAVLLIKLFKRKKIILDCDDYELHVGKFNNRLQRKVFQLFEDKVPKFCDMITVNTLFMKKRLINMGIPKQRIVYLPNGVDVSRFKINDKKLENIREKLKISDKKVIGYIGSFDLTGHSIDLLVKAFVELHNENNNLVLLMVGRGSEEDMNELKSMLPKDVQNDVKWIGFINPDEVKYYYKLSDVIVDPVKKILGCEARSPLKIFEGMIMGVPIITGNLLDRRDILKNGKYGVLTEPGSVEELKKDLKKVLYSKKYSKHLSIKSLERSKDYYWNKLAKIFISKIQNGGCF